MRTAGCRRTSSAVTVREERELLAVARPRRRRLVALAGERHATGARDAAGEGDEMDVARRLAVCQFGVVTVCRSHLPSGLGAGDPNDRCSCMSRNVIGRSAPVAGVQYGGGQRRERDGSRDRDRRERQGVWSWSSMAGPRVTVVRESTDGGEIRSEHEARCHCGVDRAWLRCDMASSPLVALECRTGLHRPWRRAWCS